MTLNLNVRYQSRNLGLACALSLMLLIVFISFFAYARDEVILEKTYNDSQNTARKASSSLENLVNGGKGIDKIHEILQNKEGNAHHQALELGSLPNIGEKAKENTSEKIQCTKDDCNVANVMGTAAIMKREIKLEELGFRKNDEQFAEDNKGYIDSARQNAKKYENKFNAITGSYKDCKEIEHGYIYKENMTCDEYYDVKHSNCPIAQIIEIDPKYTYQCIKKRQDYIKTCNDEITSITCRKSSECDNGGIILSSVKTNLQNQAYSYPTLYVGTPYWEPYYCTKDDTKYTTFEVKNLNNIKEFTLTKVLFDDHLLIKVNGKKVYLGPEDDGDRLEVIEGSRRGTITTNGVNRKVCERSTNWHRSPNVDLRPFLKEGENKISITIITAGHGNAQIWIKAVQHCCRDEDWLVMRKTTCMQEGQ